MATPTFCCGGECGGLGHIALVATASISTTTVRSGVRSFRCNPTGSTGYVSVTGLTSGPRHIGRFYIWFTSLPNQDCVIARYGSGNTGPVVRFKLSDSKIYAAVDTTLGATGVTVTTGQWYCVDYDFNVNTGGADFCNVQVNFTACGQATGTGQSVNATQIDIGVLTVATTANFFIDDIVMSSTAADYPFGAGKVLSFVPNADGTHTATGTTIVKGTIAAPTGGGNVAGATDVFNWVNGRPLLGGATDNTRLVNQQTAGGTLYAEVDFEPTTEPVGPRAVEIITADREASTATCDFQAKLNDNGTENVIIARGVVAGSTTDRYARKHYATMVGGGDWTLSRFNALKVRWGYSTDATPDVYWRGVMIEAEFPEIAVSQSLTPHLLAGD